MDDSRKMQIVQELMDQLQDLMQPSEDDLGERLGKPKSVDIMKIQAGGPDMDKGSSMSNDDSGMDDDSMGPDEDDMMDSSPDEMLKRRLMKLRE